MRGEGKQRAKGRFRCQARELRDVARQVKLFGLPGPTTERAIEKIKRIATEIERGPEEPEDGSDG